MRQITVGMAAMAVSADPDCELVTYALGSCIGLVAWHPLRKVGGLLHYMLPDSAACPDKARENPAMFADLGIPLFIHEVNAASGGRGGLVLTVTGGAKRYEDHGTFDIGRRNHLALRRVLWRLGLLVASEDVGGTIPRTVRLGVGSGRVVVSSEGREWTL